jgi:hypothetical protein
MDTPQEAEMAATPRVGDMVVYHFSPETRWVGVVTSTSSQQLVRLHSISWIWKGDTEPTTSDSVWEIDDIMLEDTTKSFLQRGEGVEIVHATQDPAE